MSAGILTTPQRANAWKEYWENIITDEGKVAFLLFLKRTRDEEKDAQAGKVLAELTQDWLRKVYRA